MPLTKEELIEAIRKANPLPPPDDNGPITKPANKYAHVPETTRDWIERLRPDDLQEIDDVRRWFRNTRVITTFGRWLLVAMVAILLGSGQVTEMVIKVIHFFTRPA